MESRPLPHQLPGQPPSQPQGEGYFFVQDVYEGLCPWGVKRGQVRELRIMSQLPKRYNTEGPRYSDHYPAIGEGTYYGTWDMCRPHTVGGRDTWLGVGQKPLPWFAAFAEAYRAAGLPSDIAPETKINPQYFPHQIKGLRHADINLSNPPFSRVLLENLAQSAGGRADNAKAMFQNTDDPRYQTLLQAIQQGKESLLATPRIDMPGAVAVPQRRDFGRTF